MVAVSATKSGSTVVRYNMVLRSRKAVLWDAMYGRLVVVMGWTLDAAGSEYYNGVRKYAVELGVRQVNGGEWMRKEIRFGQETSQVL